MEFNIPGYVQRDQNWINKAKKLYSIQEKRRQLEKLESILLDELRSISNEENSQGGGFIFENYLRLGSIEYKNIPELKAVNLENYRKPPVTCWKLKNLTLVG